PFLRKPITDDAGNDIGRTASRERHDDLDRACGIILRVRGRHRRDRGEQDHGAEKSAPGAALAPAEIRKVHHVSPHRGPAAQSTEILAAVTTGPHSSSLRRIISRISSGVLPSGSASSERMRARRSGILKAWPIAPETLPAISFGVPGGAATAIQVSA